MKNKKIIKTKYIRPSLKEIKIGCSVMDNEGPGAYVKIPKKQK